MTASQQTQKASWNRGRLVEPKPQLKSKHVWAIRTRLRHDGRTRDLALFNVAIDSNLRGRDLVERRVADIHSDDSVRLRTTVIQWKAERQASKGAVEEADIATWLG